MQLKRVAEAKLPTPWGDFLMVGFEELATGQDHVALVYGDISGQTPVLSRVHSECLTGDALFSLRCDCGFQLEAALSHIAEEGRGVLLYHRQEGRNIGLLNKTALMRYRTRVTTRSKPTTSWALPLMNAISPCVQICSSCWAWMKCVC